jgi:hypothetical protein
MFRQVISASARVILSIFLVIFLFLAAPARSVAQERNGPTKAPTCTAGDALARGAELPAGSGLVASSRSPGRFWAHNDSGKPLLIALDSKGTPLGSVSVGGAKVEDWEALAVGPCPAGSCIYIGDIGDNDAERRDITIYRVPEPMDVSGSIDNAEVFRARYPDGAHDAETLLVTPKGDVLIVTKGDTGPVGLYRLPSDAKPGGSVTLQSIGNARQSGRTPANERITDGAVSPSGAWVALRTNTSLLLYRTDDLIAGNWKETSRVSLTQLGEPQGEGIAFGDEKSIYLVGEGGRKSQPGTFARLTCTF